jgi:membrane protein
MGNPSASSFISAARETILDFIEDDPLGEAAALSFYTLLSIVPLLLIVVAVAGLVWGDEAATGQLEIQITAIVGPEAAGVIQGVIGNASRSTHGPVAVSLGVVTLLFGATGGLVRLKAALNRIWRVPPVRGHGALWRFLHTRLMSLTLVLVAGLLLILSLASSAALAAGRRRLQEVIPGYEPMWGWDGLLTSWLAIALLLTLIYRLLPDAKVSWSSAAAGAISTTVFFYVGRSLVGLYIHRAGIGSAFGAAGSLVVLLIWIFYSALSLLLGAEVAKVWSRRHRRQRA